MIRVVFMALLSQ